MSVNYVEAEEYDAQGNDINQLWMAHKNFGVISGLEVTEAPTPGMSVYISPGTVQLGTIEVVKSTSTELALTSDTTYPRKALIVIGDDGSISAVYGTPDEAVPSSKRGRKCYKPKPPPVPADKVVLAEVYIDANDTEITQDDIKDRRVFISPSLQGDLIISEVIRSHNSVDEEIIESGDPTVEKAYDSTTGEKVIKVNTTSSDDVVHFDIKYYLPPNFEGWRTNDCIIVKVRIPVAGGIATVKIYDTNGDLESISKSKSTSGVEELSFDSSELTGTYSPNGRMTIRLTASCTIGGKYILFGFVRLHMKVATES